MRRYATRPNFSPFRGLKPTATFTPSLRDSRNGSVLTIDIDSAAFRWPAAGPSGAGCTARLLPIVNCKNAFTARVRSLKQDRHSPPYRNVSKSNQPLEKELTSNVNKALKCILGLQANRSYHSGLPLRIQGCWRLLLQFHHHHAEFHMQFFAFFKRPLAVAVRMDDQCGKAVAWRSVLKLPDDEIPECVEIGVAPD